ncbi:MAG: efflux RND transporter periplasmic adaptor subunit [Spirochaetales bacterium]|nr:efflux RND transporter periplasmic adaptor subunit [Spirochaetales bacterium]
MKQLKPGAIIALAIPLVFIGLVVLQLLSGGREEIAFLPTPVVAHTPSIRTIEEQITFSGNLRPETTAMVIPKVSGRIIELLVSEGDVVTQDQVIARLDDQVLQLQAQQARSAYEAAESQYQKAVQGARPEEVANAQASLNQARQDLETAQNNFERTENLYRAGTISQARFEEAQNGFQNAQTQVNNAERSLNLLIEGARSEDVQTARAQAEGALRQFELAELQLSYAQITSPVTGRIARVLADEGNLASPQSPLFSVISEGTIFANIPVPEGLYGRFLLTSDTIGVRVRPIAYPGEIPFLASISRIGSTIDPGTRTFEVEVGVENRQDLLRPGMYVNVDFTLATLEEALVLPARAVLQREGRRIVFAFEPAEGNRGTARIVPIVPGGETRDFVQILEGIEPSTQIIVNGNSFLEDGQPVRSVEVAQ